GGGGGAGAEGGNGFGGGLFDGALSISPTSLGTPTTLTVLGSSLEHNTALGGDGEGGDGGDGLGGGLYLAGTESIFDTFIGRNRAIGGDGSDGGNRYGGRGANDGQSSAPRQTNSATTNH